jgi:hypothetical protein
METTYPSICHGPQGAACRTLGCQNSIGSAFVELQVYYKTSYTSDEDLATLKIAPIREGLSITAFYILTMIRRISDGVLPSITHHALPRETSMATKAAAVSAIIKHPAPRTPRQAHTAASQYPESAADTPTYTTTCAAARWSPLRRHRHRHKSTDRTAHDSVQRHCPIQSPLLPAPPPR